MFTEILEIVKSIRDFLGQLVKGIKEGPKWVRTSLVLVLALSLFGGGIFWGFKLAHTPERVGGVDVSAFCTFYRYGTLEQETCSSPLDLKDACEWQYQRSGLTYEFSSPSAYSATCYAPGRQPLGGINDLQGYCGWKYHSASAVTAKLVGNAWTCRVKIDMRLACQLAHQLPDVEARKEDGEWSCYA
ncbi:hypothetical protein AB0L05_20920 [Nonomuraea pusilla]|uniref:hypothetical protein n=1 Tax=Nonomuraea pusilla TaxID=46177 RepID=UPI003318B834